MMIKSIEELTIYESPDGGKTIYTRKNGTLEKTLHSIDPEREHELNLSTRWLNLRDAVFSIHPAIDDLLHARA